MAEKLQSTQSTTQHRRHHRHHGSCRSGSSRRRKRRIRNIVLLATVAVLALSYLGLKFIGPEQVSRPEIMQYSYPVRVAEVLDGDSFKAVNEKGDSLTIHIYSIEAPELDQPGGYEAHKSLFGMILQRRVEVTPKGELAPGQIQAVVTTRDNSDVADQLLRSGLVWYRNDTVNELGYMRAERFAQEEGAGIWSRPDNVAPWVWREQKRSKQ